MNKIHDDASKKKRKQEKEREIKRKKEKERERKRRKEKEREGNRKKENKTGLQPVSMTCETGSLFWRVGRGCKV